MKSISITKSFILLILFIAIGCTGNQQKSKESESQQATEMLLDNETNAEFPTARYAGTYKFSMSEQGNQFGRVSIYCQEGDSISFDLFVRIGAPTHNSGALYGTLKIENGKGVFKNNEFGNCCVLEFIFTDDSVKISQQEGGYECGFSNGVFVNNTFVREQADVSSFPAGKISEEMLWEIFMKISEDNIPEYRVCKTIKQRKLAKINEQLKKQDEECDNYLRYDEMDRYGIRNIMGIGGYLTEDEKKIIALFYYGGGEHDIASTEFKQTYEYDIATGELKTIECPMDPFTEDEFINESILSPKQIKQLRAFFRAPYGDEHINYFQMDRDGFEVYFSAYNAFENWDEYGKYESLMMAHYDHIGMVRREWNGKRFVKAESTLNRKDKE